MTPLSNPLLLTSELPDFVAMGPEHVGPALDELLAAAQAGLERAVSAEVAADYDTLALVLDVPVERLNRAWAQVCHLQAVADTPAWRAAHAQNQPRMVDFYTRQGADERLYAKYKTLASQAHDSLGPTRRQVLAHALRDFVLGGAELKGAQRQRYAAIQERCAALSQQFGDHVLDATEDFALYVSAEQLLGVPEDVCKAARARAQAEGREGYKLSLQSPCYQPVVTHAQDRALRQTLFRAFATRASEFGPPQWDNTAVVQELLQLRQEEAALLGHASFGELSLVPKMASSPAQVLAFVRELAQRARPFAEREVADLQAFAASELGLPDLQAWDRAFAAEKLKQSRYAFSSEEVKQYFTEPQVLQGLFDLTEKLFGVAIRPASAPVWHASVRFYRVLRGEQAVAAFYLDLHARVGKQAGAWMDSCRTRWQRPQGGLQLPVAHLICNFAAPVAGRPALLGHDDLITLFHEFGHGLHHMLTTVDELAVAGLAGVEDDAVELPSQFMENFCWEWHVLQRLSAHVDTGQALPRALYERMLSARHFHSGLALLRQCEYALFDMRVHTESSAAARVQSVADEVSAEVQPMQAMKAPDFYRYAVSFSHLFDGGYAAGYYGYAWAQVLSADAYSAFEEHGVFDADTGQRFRENILEVGGSRPAMDSFKAFRGRAPQIEALLRHQGLA